MNLSTTYLGLKLAHPFMPGASPLVDDLDMVRRLEDAGASAMVMHSLFEEQITGQHYGSIYQTEMYASGKEEVDDRFPKANEYRLGRDEYLTHLQKVKAAVKVPVIASLNGHSSAGWVDYASHIEQAGADAMEMNVYILSSDPTEPSVAVENRVIDVVRAVKQKVKIPVAVKITPFYASLSHFAHNLEKAGANGMVLFNRFYMPDIDLDEMAMVPTRMMTDAGELPLRLRWLAILSRQLTCDLACSGGVHQATDAIKAVVAGAQAVQIVSALMLHGPGFIKTLVEDVKKWCEQHHIATLHQIRGRADISFCPDVHVFERGNYVKGLQTWEK